MCYVTWLTAEHVAKCVASIPRTERFASVCLRTFFVNRTKNATIYWNEQGHSFVRIHHIDVRQNSQMIEGKEQKKIRKELAIYVFHLFKIRLVAFATNQMVHFVSPVSSKQFWRIHAPITHHKRLSTNTRKETITTMPFSSQNKCRIRLWSCHDTVSIPISKNYIEYFRLCFFLLKQFVGKWTK